MHKCLFLPVFRDMCCKQTARRASSLRTFKEFSGFLYKFNAEAVHIKNVTEILQDKTLVPGRYFIHAKQEPSKIIATPFKSLSHIV